jgi:hypothetical protein
MADGAHASQMKTPWFSDKVYDVLKYIAQIVLPGLGTLYATVGFIWSLPNPDKVVATIVAVDAFLGLLLQLSQKSYEKSDTKYDGELEIEEPEGGPRMFSLHLYAQPEDLVGKDQIVFKVPRSYK